MVRVQTKQGFTLIEVLVVVALVAILASITFIAINPAKNFADARNAQRSFDVGEILSAATQYTSTQGNTVAGLGTITVCPAQTVLGTGAGNLDLTTPLVDSFIPGIPMDPSVGTAANTGYTICKTSTGRITVTAPNAENGKVISVKR